MKLSLTTTSGKVLASVVVMGAAAAVAGLGTFGTFTSTTSASAAVSTGTVNIALGTAGTAANRLTVAATDVVPGDTVQRAVQLSNTGTSALSGVVLSTTATASSKLDTDAASGLQLQVQSCPTAWAEAGNAPAHTYTCASPSTVLSSRPVIGTAMPLGALSSLTPGKTDNLLVTLSLPSSADNTFQGLASTVSFAFTGTQRGAQAR